MSKSYFIDFLPEYQRYFLRREALYHKLTLFQFEKYGGLSLTTKRRILREEDVVDIKFDEAVLEYRVIEIKERCYCGDSEWEYSLQEMASCPEKH